MNGINQNRWHAPSAALASLANKLNRVFHDTRFCQIIWQISKPDCSSDTICWWDKNGPVGIVISYNARTWRILAAVHVQQTG